MTDLRLLRAGSEDTVELAAVSKRAFDGDVDYGSPQAGGPHGYDSPEWQANVTDWRGATYFKALLDGRIIGGAVCFDQGRGHIYLGRIFLDLESQNQGLGRQVMALLMAEYPSARVWTLQTPEWNQRTQHFYELVGFTKVRTDGEGCHYELRVGSRADTTGR